MTQQILDISEQKMYSAQISLRTVWRIGGRLAPIQTVFKQISINIDLSLHQLRIFNSVRKIKSKDKNFKAHRGKCHYTVVPLHSQADLMKPSSLALCIYSKKLNFFFGKKLNKNQSLDCP
jgi:hypothetical protein